jgi:hypothetical protein
MSALMPARNQNHQTHLQGHQNNMKSLIDILSGNLNFSYDLATVLESDTQHNGYGRLTT